MVFLGPTVLAVIFGSCSAWVRGSGDAGIARKRCASVAVVGVLLEAGFLFVPNAFPVNANGWMPSGMLAIAPLVTALVALISVGAAALATHDQATFARMMLLFAVAEAFLATDHPLILVPLWAASSGIAWADVRQRCHEHAWHRVFGFYHFTSLAGFAAGAILLWRGVDARAATVALLLGIAIREGIMPVHSWFPRFVEHAPMGIVVAFIAPQLGVYAQLQLLHQSQLGGFPQVVATFGAVTAVAAAMLGVVQVKARRALAYLILSQSGLVAFGLESQSSIGLVGALLNWQVLAIATSGFAMALKALEARRGPMTLATPQGSFSQTPKLGVAFLVLGLASVGFPLTLGFIAEDLLVQGTVEEFPVLGLSLVVATAFNGVTVLRAFFYLFTGTGKTLGEPDLDRREGYLFGFAMTVLLVFGLFPGLLVSFEDPKTEDAKQLPHVDQRQVLTPGDAHP